MRREITRNSGRRIIITSLEDGSGRAMGAPVACCLLTAWANHDPGSRMKAVQYALESKCRYFMCAGSKARELHDALDESIESAALADGGVMDAEGLPTTACFEGSANEIADVFLHSGDPKLTTRTDSVWLAILDETCDEDSAIIGALVAGADQASPS